jgi:hypothetical protein
VRDAQRSRRDQAHLVTEARPSLSDDIAYRQRRYLIMMGIRTVCFIAAIVLFANHLGWVTAIPLVGAIVIPYFAVVFANGGREPTINRGFKPYEPNTPELYRPPSTGSGDGQYVPPAPPPAPPPAH